MQVFKNITQNTGMRFLKDLLLYISAFVPMYALIFVKLVVELINNNLTFNVLNTINFVTLLLLMALGVLGIVWNVFLNTDESCEVVILSKKNITDQHFLGYFSLFVFFAIPIDLSYMSGYFIYVIVIVLIGIVYVGNGLYYINPLLNILGYNFYDITFREKGSEQVRNAKMFYKGDLQIEDKAYFIKLKNTNFTFIDKKHKKI